MGFYSTEPVNDHLTCIRSMTGELLYLVEGTEKAALIDTCVGIGHLKDYVEKLTDKPIVVLISHGHIDHAMGAPEFETVYMDHKDIPLYQNMCDVEGRKGYVMAGLEPRYSEIEEDYVPPMPEKEFLELSDGMIFDLGGIHIKAIALHGHTPGCTAFLIEEDRIMILGDAANNSTFLFDPICATVDQYQKNLKEFDEKTKGTYDRVFLMHHEMETQVELIQSLIDLCDDIKNGNTDDVPFNFMGHQVYIAKKADDHFHRLDGKVGNIIYSKERIM